jgi:hypothetical protein
LSWRRSEPLWSGKIMVYWGISQQTMELITGRYISNIIYRYLCNNITHINIYIYICTYIYIWIYIYIYICTYIYIYEYIYIYTFYTHCIHDFRYTFGPPNLGPVTWVFSLKVKARRSLRLEPGGTNLSLAKTMGKS